MQVSRLSIFSLACQIPANMILQFVFNVSNPMPDAGYVKLFPGAQQLGVSIPAENLLYQISYDSAHAVWASFQCTWSHSLCLEHATPLWIRETLSTGLCALLAGPQPKPHSPHGLPKAWWMGVPYAPICKASKQQWIRSEAKTLSVNSWAHTFADHLPFHRSLNLSGQPLSCKLKGLHFLWFQKLASSLPHLQYHSIHAAHHRWNSGMIPM